MHLEKLLPHFRAADFVMLRYESEYTPCTGITAVAKQERRHFARGLTISPWSPQLGAAVKAVASGTVSEVVGVLPTALGEVRLRVANDAHAPLVFVEMDGRFQGKESPYDTPELKRDSLYFGVAVNQVLRAIAEPRQFVWGADWQSVPALVLLRERHHVALTLHNTFDECLRQEANELTNSHQLNSLFARFLERRTTDRRPKTALEIGLETADVATTVNRGFAFGIREEPIQREIMARHLRNVAKRIVGINNASFTDLSPELKSLAHLLRDDFAAGCEQLRRQKEKATAALPAEIRSLAKDKVIVVAMGRRTAQKLHEVVVASTRSLLAEHPDLPLVVVFATTHGDDSSAARLKVIEKLVQDFPNNAISYDGKIGFFNELMAGADYNCMPSLYEPHGGAFSGTVVPIARAIDGLAEQIRGASPTGQAHVINRLWHSEHEAPSGLLFRETPLPESTALRADLRGLLCQSPAPDNDTFDAMVAGLSETLLHAVDLRLNRFAEFARLVAAALEKQQGQSWLVNLGGMLALVEQARVNRPLK